MTERNGAGLTLRGVRFHYGDLDVLEGIDLDVRPGARLVILGPNGAGKTTLLRIMAGVLSPSEGGVQLDGSDIASLKGSERARRIAFVPQETRVAFDFTVLEIVLMGRSPHLGFLGIEGRRDLDVARRALEFTDAAHLADRPLSRLSSGERQRVLLSRALAQEPQIVLLDEPTAFLDLGHQVGIHGLLANLNEERGTTVVFVSHDLNLAARYAARAVLLSRGRITAEGSPADLLTPDRLRAVFGVETEVLTVAGASTVAVLGPAKGRP